MTTCNILKTIGCNRSGKEVFGMIPGTMNQVGEEPAWSIDQDCWVNEYGPWKKGMFLSAPVISRMRIRPGSDSIEIQAICSSTPPDQFSNLRYIVKWDGEWERSSGNTCTDASDQFYLSPFHNSYKWHFSSSASLGGAAAARTRWPII